MVIEGLSMMLLSHGHFALTAMVIVLSFGLGLVLASDGPSIGYLKEPPGRVDFSNNTGTKIECVAFDSVATTWIFADGTSVNNITGLRQVNSDGTLIFHPFSSASFRQDVHSATYRCEATGHAGLIVSRDVKVHAVMDVEYDSSVYDVFAIRGNTAVLKCHIPSFLQQFVSVVAYIKDDSLKIATSIQLDAKFSLSPSGALHIKNASASDAGSSYRCQTLPRLSGHMKTSSVVGRLFVTEPRGNVPPKIIDTLSTVEVHVGESVALPCVAQGFPTPVVQWYIRSVVGDLLLGNQNGLIRQISNGLIFSKVQLSDTGVYICKANNTVGSDYVEVSLSVTAPLFVEVSPQTQLAEIGRQLSMNCIVKGYPVSSISWLKNGRPLNAQRVKVINRENILIEAATVEDKGMYQCFARNMQEMAQGIAEVRLGDFSPMLRSIFTDKTIKPGPSHSMSCTVTGNPPPQITWTLDMLPVSNSATRQIKEATNSEGHVISTLSIKNSTPSDGGAYTCSGTNMHGTVRYSARFNIYGPLTARKVDSVALVDSESTFLFCPIFGYPVSSFVWEKDSLELPSNVRQEIFKNGSLLLSNVQKKSDAGEYLCSTTDTRGVTVKAKIPVRILVAPKVNPFAFQDDLIREGVRARISCVVIEGDSPVHVRWTKDGKPLILTELQDISIQDVDEYSSILAIKSINPKHNGNYSCVASNAAGTTSHTARLFVNVAPRIVPFSFQGEHSFEGVLARVSCVVYQGDLPIVLSWERDGVPLGSSPEGGVSLHTVDAFTSILTIERVRSEHAGNYSCLAKNSAASVRHSAQLVVTVPPYWVNAPEGKIIVMLGQSAQFDCVAGGHPISKITWTFGKDTMLTDYFDGVRLFPNGTLYIHEVKDTHNGNYFCHASNGIGAGISRVARLIIQKPAKITTKTDVHTVARGGDVVLNCTATGNAPLNITWLINGKTLDGKKQTRFSVHESTTPEEFTSSLQLKKIDKSDNKVVTCVASNRHGSDKVNLTVVVQGLPDSPHTVKAVEKNDRDVEITWMRPFDGNSPITKYVVEYRESGNGSMKSETLNAGGATTVTFSDLKPSLAYKFSVFAENAVGRSETAGVAELTLAGEVPHGSPENVEITPLDLNSLKVSWQPPARASWNGNIRGYYVGYREADLGGAFTFRMLEVPEGYEKGLSFTLAELKKFTQYAIVTQAFNDQGKGPLSQEVLVMTSEGVPSLSPGDVECTISSAQSLSVNWQPIPHKMVNGIIRGYRVLYFPVQLLGSDGQLQLNIYNTTYTKASLKNLDKFTNYSVQVVGYTSAGDGVASKPVFCQTSEDVPNPPEILKALPASSESVILVWKPSKRPNARISFYTINVESIAEHSSAPQGIQKHTVNGNVTSYTVDRLKNGHKYKFFISASSLKGEGQPSFPVFGAPTGPRVGAKILAFGEAVHVSVGSPVLFACPVIGNPSSRRNWLSRGQEVDFNEGILTNSNGNLLIKSVQLSDAGDYVCQVDNNIGQDEVKYSLIVQAAPSSPTLLVTTTTSSSVSLTWKLGSSGNSPITGFSLNFKQEDGSWQTTELQPYLTSFVLGNLHCGSTYLLYMVANNKIGSGQPSETVSVTTTGSVPKLPVVAKLVEESTTHVALRLDSWIPDGCPIQYFVVEYKSQLSRHWVLFSNDLRPDNPIVRMGDLEAGTWYNLRMTAHTDAGSTVAEYNFATLTLNEGTIPKNIFEEKPDLFTALNLHIALPTAICVVVVLLCVTLTMFWVKRKRNHGKNSGKKGNKSSKSKSKSKTNKCRSASMADIPDSRSNSLGSYDDIAPYATVKLSDIQRKERHAPLPRNAGMAIPAWQENKLSVPFGSAYNPSAPPMSESYSHQSGFFQKGMGAVRGISPASYAQMRKERVRPLQDAMSPIKTITPISYPRIPDEVPMETTFVFPPPPNDILDNDYDPPPPNLDWLPKNN